MSRRIQNSIMFLLIIVFGLPLLISLLGFLFVLLLPIIDPSATTNGIKVFAGGLSLFWIMIFTAFILIVCLLVIYIVRRTKRLNGHLR